jgi:hypothetical protein
VTNSRIDLSCIATPGCSLCAGFPAGVCAAIMSGMERKSCVAIALAAASCVVAAIGLTTEAFADQPPTPFPVNSAGLTYGSAADADSPENEPDLIFVLGTNGHDGYVRRSDLDGPTPSSPEEAIAMQESDDGQRGRNIPVFDQTGVHVIDIFHIAGSAETSTN